MEDSFHNQPCLPVLYASFLMRLLGPWLDGMVPTLWEWWLQWGLCETLHLTCWMSCWAKLSAHCTRCHSGHLPDGSNHLGGEFVWWSREDLPALSSPTPMMPEDFALWFGYLQGLQQAAQDHLIGLSPLPLYYSQWGTPNLAMICNGQIVKPSSQIQGHESVGTGEFDVPPVETQWAGCTILAHHSMLSVGKVHEVLERLVWIPLQKNLVERMGPQGLQWSEHPCLKMQHWCPEVTPSHKCPSPIHTHQLGANSSTWFESHPLMCRGPKAVALWHS